MTMLANRPSPARVLTGEAGAAPTQGAPGSLQRFLRGRGDDPAWARPALLGLLVVTGVAYVWALGDSGWANSFYAAAVQAGTKSWKAFFFGSSDASNFITVDKPPAALWVMELSARIFGLNSWSLLVPQALEGVATVALVYATVRRWFSASAALLGAGVVASTPVAVLMFRYNNPDALLVLLITVAVYATVRALERVSLAWLALAAAAIGTGFITKMLQAFLVVPAIGVVYLLAAPTSIGRRIRHLLAAAVVLVVASGWWVAIVQLVPAADRPYVGGSQNNSILNLIFGYNGLGRISGNETGSVGGRVVAGSSMWGPTGIDRLFLSSMGGQISWFIPAVVILVVACLWLTRRAPRTDHTRAALVLFGGWFLVTAVVFSYAQGIIHPYYNVALAPPIGALIGIGTVTLWHERHRHWARLALSIALAATSIWAYVLLDRSPTWMPWLRVAVLAIGLAAAVLVALPARLGRRSAFALGLTALVVALGGPVAYALDTVATPHTGAIPSAGPTVAGTQGGPGGAGPGGGGPGGGGFGRGGFGGARGTGGAGAFAGGGRPGTGAGSGTGTGFGGAPGAGFGGPGVGSQSSTSGGPPGAAAFPGVSSGSVSRGAFRSGGRPGAGTGTPGGGGAGGGFLNSTTPGKAVVALLEDHASRFTWIAATVNSNSAAGYQLATDDPVMAIGGFNGTDPAPSLATFERYVRAGKIHYFIAGSGGFGGGGTATTASTITSWVESHFSSQTVDGVTLYDLTSR